MRVGLDENNYFNNSWLDTDDISNNPFVNCASAFFPLPVGLDGTNNTCYKLIELSDEITTPSDRKVYVETDISTYNQYRTVMDVYEQYASNLALYNQYIEDLNTYNAYLSALDSYNQYLIDIENWKDGNPEIPVVVLPSVVLEPSVVQEPSVVPRPPVDYIEIGGKYYILDSNGNRIQKTNANNELLYYGYEWQFDNEKYGNITSETTDAKISSLEDTVIELADMIVSILEM